MAIIKNIDVLGEEIFWIDEVVPLGLVQNWWQDVINYGKWDKGFLAYGGNPPHPSMDKTGDPQLQEIIRNEGSFSTEITGTRERQTWYMNVSRSREAFKEAATKAYKKIQDGNEPYWQDPEVNEKAEKTGFGLQEHQFDHHPMIHQTVNMIWSMYKSVFEDSEFFFKQLTVFFNMSNLSYVNKAIGLYIEIDLNYYLFVILSLRYYITSKVFM